MSFKDINFPFTESLQKCNIFYILWPLLLQERGQTCICIFLASPDWLHHGLGSGKIHKDWMLFLTKVTLTADWSLSGHLSIWSPDMWLRVSMCGVDEVDNHQPWHRSTRASSQSTQSSDHTFYHLDSALFLIEIICQFRHIKFLIKNKQVSIP